MVDTNELRELLAGRVKCMNSTRYPSFSEVIESGNGGDPWPGFEEVEIVVLSKAQADDAMALLDELDRLRALEARVLAAKVRPVEVMDERTGGYQCNAVNADEFEVGQRVVLLPAGDGEGGGNERG